PTSCALSLPDALPICEAEEEINLPATEVDLLGELTPLYIPPTNYCVHPFVGALRTPPTLRPCEDEVADILQVPLAELLTPDSRRSEEHTSELQSRENL